MTITAPMLGSRTPDAGYRRVTGRGNTTPRGWVTPQRQAAKLAERIEFAHECDQECADFVSTLLGTDEPVDGNLADADAKDYLGAAQDWLDDRAIQEFAELDRTWLDEPDDAEILASYGVSSYAELAAVALTEDDVTEAEEIAWLTAGGDTESNFLAVVGSVYDVDDDWYGWSVTTRP